MKKRICIITSSYPRTKDDPRNEGVWIRDFALLLSKKGFKVDVISPYKKGSKNDLSGINVHFFPWLHTEFGLSSLNPKNLLQFVRLLSVLILGSFYTVNFIKKNNIDVCFAMWIVPSGIFAFLTKIFFKKPYFVLSLGSDVYRIHDYPFGEFILKKVLKNADKLFADGKELIQIIESLSKRKCEYIGTGRVLENIKKEITYTKFDSSKINFIFLGRYHESKGVDLLVEAISTLDEKEKANCLFHIFGGGPLEKKIKQMVNDRNLEKNTFINSYVKGEEIFSYLSNSDFVIIPSRSDSLSMVLFESIQAKKPLIVTNVGDMERIITKYEIGYVVEPNSIGIANGIKNALNSPALQLDGFISAYNKLKKDLDSNEGIEIITRALNEIK